MPKYPEISVLIPTLNRSESLKACLKSLETQTFQNFEYILVTDEGPLAKIRNQGAKLAKGSILAFSDDDVVFSNGWLQGIWDAFHLRPEIVGVSGPSIISQEFKLQRDLFRYGLAKKFYDKFFCEGKESLPGHICRSGAWTTGASLWDCSYKGEVDFLEACNMSFRRDAFFSVGGFDETFGGVGDWSEPDLAFRLRGRGGRLWFSPKVRLEHRPSRSGAYGKRSRESKLRMANYELFSKRWIRPHWKHALYKLFLRGYFGYKDFIRS